jgi:hypothetical protein
MKTNVSILKEARRVAGGPVDIHLADG